MFPTLSASSLVSSRFDELPIGGIKSTDCCLEDLFLLHPLDSICYD